MKVAVMQPYFLPYLGYFQLAHAVDHFVFLDDVTFIKQGWINRNQILVHGRKKFFSIPLDHAGSNVRIRDLKVHDASFARWRPKFFKTIEHSYRRAPCYAQVLQLLNVLLPPDGQRHIASLAIGSITGVMQYLQLPFVHSVSSQYSIPQEVNGLERVKYLCKLLGAETYYNLPGGMGLWAPRDTSNDFEPQFLVSEVGPYSQGRGEREFVPSLSVLDVLMFNRPHEVRAMLTQFRRVSLIA